MAEEKPKGDPAFLTIAGKKVTLPGVTSFSTDDELLSAANNWIAQNYNGPQVGAPTVFRTPKMDEKGGFKPGEEIVVQAPVARPFEQSLLGAAGEGAQQIIGEQLGIDPSTMAALAPDQGFISQFNRNLLQSAQPFTQMLELGSAAPTAALSGLTQLAYNLGLTSEDPRRTAAAAEEAINVGLLPLGTMTGPRVPTARQLLRETPLSPQMTAIAEPTPPAPVVPTTLRRAQAAEMPEAPALTAAVPEAAVVPKAAVVPQIKLSDAEGQAALAAMEQKGLTKPTTKLDVAEKILQFESKYLQEAGLSRPKDITFKDFFFSHFEAGTLPRQRAVEIAKQAGIEPQELSEFIRGTAQAVREAGQVLNRAKVAAQSIPVEAADLAKLGTETPDALSLWKRIGNIQRGNLVSNLATTVRNTIGSVIRQPIDIATNLTDTAITAALNPFRNDPVGANALDAFAVITDRFKPAQNKKFYEQLKTYKPGINQELLATYASDVSRTTQTDKLSKVEKVVDTMNLLNRVTETVTRNVMFPVYLRRQMTKAGLNFDELISSGRLNDIPQEMFERALTETLDYTYAGRPGKDTVMGRIGNRIIDTVEDLGPIGVSVAPFPRFMMAAIKFQSEYNPAAALYRGLAPKNIAALKGGDAEALAKSVVGSALLYSAYLYRTSESAGEKWYEGKRADGSIIDLRPYYPLAPYLLVADIYKRINTGENVDMAFAAKDIIQGLTGAQFRAGTGLYVVDELFKDVQGAGNAEEVIKKVGSKWLADQGAMFLNGLQQFKDFYAQYNPEEAIYRDAKESFAGTLLRAVPGAQRALGLPEGESPAMEGPMTTQDPALRQLLGATIRPAKNIVQSELDRLGFEQYEVGSRTGEPAIDRLINRDLGVIAERGIAPLLQSPEYQRLDTNRKTAAIKQIYAKAREAAVAKFTAENPELALLRRYKTMKREEKSILNEQVEASTGMTADALLRQLSEAPLMKSQAQYDALPNGTKFTDPGDYKVYTKGE